LTHSSPLPRLKKPPQKDKWGGVSKNKTSEGVPRSGDVRQSRGIRSLQSSPTDGLGEFLSDLKDDPTDRAWSRFLERYSSLLMKVARFHAQSPDLAQDCFIFICEKIVEKNFRRVVSFRPEKGVPFRAWLSAVANNLARDWHRHEFGRQRLPSVVQAMGELDQAVYRLKYLKHLENTACLTILRHRFPRVDRQRLSESLARLHQAFSPEARWRLSFVNNSPEHRQISYESGFVALPFTKENETHETAEADEDLRQLKSALDQLSPHQRLLVRLRYEQQLSLEQIARIAGCTNLHQARRQVEEALKMLRRLILDQQN